MSKTRTLLIPAQTALVLDRDGWHLGTVPPAWWIEATSPEVADEPQEQPAPPVDPSTGRTSCRPGHGPCRRRHEHASRRRAAA